MSQGFARKLGVIGAPSAQDGGVAVFDGTSGTIIKDTAYDMFVNQVDGRLTLTSGTPVTTSDVTGATTIYFTPYKGNNIAVYDTTNAVWKRFEFSEISIAVPATINQMYDVWVYNNSGTLALELLAWTNDTTRATALTTQDGVYVKSGDATRRYLGSFRTTGVSGQTENSVTKTYLWNYYNRVNKRMYVADIGNHSYTAQTWRSWNNSTTYRLETVIGVIEDSFQAGLRARLAPGVSGDTCLVSIGDNSTSVQESSFIFGNDIGTDTIRIGVSQSFTPSNVGYNYYQALEYGGLNVSSFTGLQYTILIKC